MTTTTFTASCVDSADHHIIGTNDKKARITLLFPESWTAAGLALDLSSTTLLPGGKDFDNITEVHWGPGSLVTDGKVSLSLFGTKDTTAADGSVTASTCKVAAFGTKNTTSADDVLAAIPDTTDLSALAAVCLTVHGY